MRRLYVFLCLMILAICTACSSSPPPPASLVLTAMQEAMIESGQPIPDGVVRLTASSAESPDHLTEVFFSALYGEAARSLLNGDESTPPVGDAAMFLSLAAYPCELAVFRTSDVRTAKTVERLCRERLDLLVQGYRESPWAEIPTRGIVRTKGCFVILVVAEDPLPIVRAALGVIGT